MCFGKLVGALGYPAAELCGGLEGGRLCTTSTQYAHVHAHSCGGCGTQLCWEPSAGTTERPAGRGEKHEQRQGVCHSPLGGLAIESGGGGSTVDIHPAVILVMICLDFPLNSTGFSSGKHLIQFLDNKRHYFLNLVWLTAFSILTPTKFN